MVYFEAKRESSVKYLNNSIPRVLETSASCGKYLKTGVYKVLPRGFVNFFGQVILFWLYVLTTNRVQCIEGGRNCLAHPDITVKHSDIICRAYLSASTEKVAEAYRKARQKYDEQEKSLSYEKK